MPLPPNERRIWVRGVPKSGQSKGKLSQGYIDRIRDAAREQFSRPVTTSVEIKILFKDWDSRPDVDNVSKRIVDAQAREKR
jgi:Holliday junction resolvase RusA-like endonuclease